MIGNNKDISMSNAVKISGTTATTLPPIILLMYIIKNAADRHSKINVRNKKIYLDQFFRCKKPMPHIKYKIAPKKWDVKMIAVSFLSKITYRIFWIINQAPMKKRTWPMRRINLKRIFIRLFPFKYRCYFLFCIDEK